MQNPREKRGSKWSNPVHFERILVQIARVWAHLSSFSSNPCSKAVQNDHFAHDHALLAFASRAFREAAVAGWRIFSRRSAGNSASRRSSIRC